ncbi:AEC family transporter [Caballeronia insecticola]|uniref:Auxin Efflux Carrier n=1 Tax=Caballeronia insecticola TaxID=758793 RepID=R4X1Z0_9BURK|nr:AEC family transporter [Caballeronia insecticola]BAN26421.1 auxin Efflux Carrier [Caballeronia insecticola]
MFAAILNGLLPVAFVIFLGWMSARIKWLKHEDAKVLATLVIKFALPFALFSGAVRTSPDKLQHAGFALTLALGLMGTYFIALCIGRFVFRHDLRTSTIQALVCAFPDMAYFGAPILSALFGPEGFLAVLVGNLITSIVMLPLTIVLTENTEHRKPNDTAFLLFLRSIGGAISNPMVWLPVLGIVISMARVPIPGPALRSVDLIGTAAGGTSLFALGLMLYGEPFLINRDVLTNLLLKNFGQPLLMFLGAAMFGLSGSMAHQTIVTGAVPTATAAAMFALRTQTYTANATATILISTLLGIVTEALLIAAMFH